MYFILGILPFVVVLLTDSFGITSFYTSPLNSEYQGIITLIGVFFSVFFGIGITRFFDKLKEADGWISTLKTVLYSVEVWTEGLDTLNRVKWVGQLKWLEMQFSNRKSKYLEKELSKEDLKWVGHLSNEEIKQLKEKLNGGGRIVIPILMPHKFHSIDTSLIYRLPDRIGDRDLLKLKHSLISVNHKIEDCLNFMLEKIHLKEELNEVERNEIIGLLNGNPTSIIPALNKELPTIQCEIEKLLLILGEDN